MARQKLQAIRMDYAAKYVCPGQRISEDLSKSFDHGAHRLAWLFVSRKVGRNDPRGEFV